MAKLEFYRMKENSITFSVRIPYVMNEQLESLSQEIDISKNKIVNMMIEFGLNNMIIIDNSNSNHTRKKQEKNKMRARIVNAK